jgi:hypothetical protein
VFVLYYWLGGLSEAAGVGMELSSTVLV